MGGDFQEHVFSFNEELCDRDKYHEQRLI